ncbi:MAG: class II D-tagatose-bisphosphate aldolase non-catalytic subunit, partial [Sporomusa sp.]
MNLHAFFKEIIQSRRSENAKSICSICSAHPLVLQAGLKNALEQNMPILIEATANQVNQFGGYTGMTPADFRDFVYSLSQECGFPVGRIILGGDHLGPFVWRDRPAEEAMRLSEELVQAYVSAGFEKIHLDTSMHLGDDDKNTVLSDSTIAHRCARLCIAAEKAFSLQLECKPGAAPPLYVIGSEVPTPGGPQEEAEAETLCPTSPERFIKSFHVFQEVFRSKNLSDAFSRIIAFVVQPGVEFYRNSVFDYDSKAAQELCAAIDRADLPLVFEGHSTDYQLPEALHQLVCDGVAILKVGPALTFALREALIALEQIENELLAGSAMQPSGFSNELEKAMMADNQYWCAYYTGTENKKRLSRRYSYLDRAR